MIGRDMQYTMYYTSDLSQGSTMITVSFTSGGVYLLLLDTLFFKVIFKNQGEQDVIMGVQRDTRVAGMQREGLPLRRGRNRDATLAVMQTEEGVPVPGPGKYVKLRLVAYFWGSFLEQVFSSAAVLTVSRIEKCHFQGLLIALRIERWRSTTRAPCFIPLYTGLHTRTHIHICICEQALF